MLKAKATLSDGRPLYIVGLSEGNLQRLREHRPIWFDMCEMGGTGQMVILWGETEGAIASELSKTFDFPDKPRGD